MSLNHLARRLHLYLALALLPWFLAYGLSSLAITRPDWFLFGDATLDPPYVAAWERPFALDIDADADWQEVGRRILAAAGDEGRFWVNHRDPQRPVVQRVSFTARRRYAYDVDGGRLVAERQPLNLRSFLVGLHFRGGFGSGSFGNDLWAVVVDAVQVGFLLWVATGLYMWWLLPGTRRWGLLAVGGGFVAFFWFMAVL